MSIKRIINTLLIGMFLFTLAGCGQQSSSPLKSESSQSSNEHIQDNGGNNTPSSESENTSMNENTQTPNTKPAVYMTTDISPAGLMATPAVVARFHYYNNGLLMA